MKIMIKRFFDLIIVGTVIVPTFIIILEMIR